MFSSALALVAAFAIVAFTFGVVGRDKIPSWSIWLIAGWSYGLALALTVWALRDWLKIHWVGNPTLSMVAGTSGSAIAAVALVFTFLDSKEQDEKIEELIEVSRRTEALLRSQQQQVQVTTPAPNTASSVKPGQDSKPPPVVGR